MSRFLAAFRASEPTASEKRFCGTYGADNPEKGGNPPPPPACPPAGGGFRGFRDCGDHTSGRTAVLTAAARAAAEALAEPDPDLDRERAEVAAALAAEGMGGFGPLAPPGEHRAALHGLLRGFAGTGPQPTLEMLA